jgi:choline kinase|tara:strand:+ start:340 stop:1008 length:669 start_codon:yes stop_codon:yes gene_type:complete
MLEIHGRSVLEWQLGEFAKCGIDDVTVAVGFGAEHVEQFLKTQSIIPRVRTAYNPFFGIADNLVTCWVARTEMDKDFLLVNGDTVFEAQVLDCVLNAPARPVMMVTDHKPTYDADDMKVIVSGERLVRVGKNISPERADGESIGMLLFREDGPVLFQQAIERAIRTPQALKQWYLSVIDDMAQSGLVWTCSIQGLQWAEIDCAEDLEQAETTVQCLEPVPNR